VSRLLFVAARFPCPPLKGDQVRAYHQLRLLGKRHRITLLAFADRAISTAERAHVAAFCEELVTVPLSRRDMAGALLRRAASPLPLQTLMYQTDAMRSAVAAHAARGFDVVHVQLARMAEHVAAVGIPCVIDFIDALSLNMERRAREQRGPLRPIVSLEARRMRAYERLLCERVAAALVVSHVDRDAIGPYRNLHVNPNGVDVDAFAFWDGPRIPDRLVFTGNMGYFPNVNAATWFAREVFPRVKAAVPGATLGIVGTDPAPEVRALAARDPAVEVTGYVDDLRVALRSATAAVVPMRAGTGIQNKVLEAMAIGTPLVVTPFALGGIDVRDGTHLLVGADAAAFAAQTVRLLREERLRAALARAARSIIEAAYSWEASVAALESVHARAASSATSLRRARREPVHVGREVYP
jgi:sugar transferase (PEP-CTERM/EpsH1 system associated)